MGSAFRGETLHKIDSKGRVSIPADFRKIIFDGDPNSQPDKHATFTIVYGDERQKCLKCFTELETIQLDKIISGMERSSAKRRFLEFFFQTRSCKIQSDSAGRIVLPENLREKAGLQEQVWFAGTGDSFEIWNKASYAEHIDDLGSMFHSEGSPIDPMALIDEER